MSSNNSPMWARGAQGAGSSRPVARSASGESAVAEAAVHRIREVLADGFYTRARDLAREAAERFPEHDEVQKLWWSFDPRGKSRIASGGAQPSRHEEFEWLRCPPEWARGKWVALIGSSVGGHG